VRLTERHQESVLPFDDLTDRATTPMSPAELLVSRRVDLNYRVFRRGF